MAVMAKILIATIQVNFVLIPSEAGMRQHKLTWIKIFSMTYHPSHFLAATCISKVFLMLAHCTLFYSLAVFE